MRAAYGKQKSSLYVTFSAGLIYFLPICFNNRPLHISFSWKEMMNDASRPFCFLFVKFFLFLSFSLLHSFLLPPPIFFGLHPAVQN